METTRKASGGSGKKSGPKDKDYVNKKKYHEVEYAPSRKTPAKKFGSK